MSFSSSIPVDVNNKILDAKLLTYTLSLPCYLGKG